MKRPLCLLLLINLAACQTSPRPPAPPPLLCPANTRNPNPQADIRDSQTPPSKPAPWIAPQPAPTGFLDLEKFRRIDTAITEAIANGKTPGGVLWVERNGQIYRKAYGNRTVFPHQEPMTLDTIFDLASLTKVIATAPAIVKLHELGKLDINDPVAKHLPTFAENDKESVTLKHLLTHTSGLRPGLALSPDWEGNDHAIKLACAEMLQTPPGSKFKYSDINYILLGEIVHRVSGRPLHQFTDASFYSPLGMRDTRFLPCSTLLPRITPTTKVESQVTRGIVHDLTSSRMGGVAGHAGLFSTAKDLAVFARMLLNRGRHQNNSILKAETVTLMTQNQSPAGLKEQRGLGWDIASPYSSSRGNLFETGSYGHTGWTGTSIWIDPFSETFVIFLSNRNHPTEDGNVIALRRTIATLVAESVIGYTFPQKSSQSRPSSKSVQPQLNTLNGIDVLKQDQFAALKGLSIGLITNHTGRDKNGQSTIDLLYQAPNLKLTALFSPEHGIRGQQDSKVEDSVDQKTGLTIFSLYGKTRQPTAEQMRGLDALVFDTQDIGCRFYTYISTMGLAMEAAAEAGLKFVVLDRINPISGNRIEGPAVTDENTFIAYHPIPIRHGMTVGELARFFAAEKRLRLDLKIVKLAGWRRDVWLDETDISWIDPSPNMRSLTEAALYPGIGLLEMTELSVGRGTPTPFEVIGAPYLNAAKLASELDQLNLPGIQLEAIRYTPTASVFANQACNGLRFTITDRNRFQPIDLGLSIAKILYRDYPQHFDLTKVNQLLRSPPTLAAIRENLSLAAIKSSWAEELKTFHRRRAPHLLY